MIYSSTISCKFNLFMQDFKGIDSKTVKNNKKSNPALKRLLQIYLTDVYFNP